MEKSLALINSSQSTCGSCSSLGCGTCTPAPSAAPSALSRREFGYAALLVSAGTLLAGCSKQSAPQETTQSAPATSTPGPAPTLLPDLEVVKESKGPIITTLEEFYKIGPGPSSSHTMGPMRITYDFFQRVTNLPEEQLKRATSLQVHLFGSLSATGKGHGTDRASLAGLLGKAPATCPPEFLDGLAANPGEVHRVTLGPTTLNLTLKDIIFDATKGDFPHPNTMTGVLLAGNEKLYELEYYSVGGGFIEWKGYKPPDKARPKYPTSMHEISRNISSTTKSLCRRRCLKMRWRSPAETRRISGSFSIRYPKSCYVALTAEGGCQAEVGVGSSMGAAMIAQAMGASPKVVSNAAESALEHHLGMTCDPVAGYVPVPCRIGAKKAGYSWRGDRASGLHGMDSLWPRRVFPPYVIGLVAGVASGSGMVPYTVIKEANPPQFGGTATGGDELPELHFQRASWSRLWLDSSICVQRGRTNRKGILPDSFRTDAAWCRLRHYPLLEGNGICIQYVALARGIGGTSDSTNRNWQIRANVGEM
jgi:hypothetical protein